MITILLPDQILFLKQFHEADNLLEQNPQGAGREVLHRQSLHRARAAWFLNVTGKILNQRLLQFLLVHPRGLRHRHLLAELGAGQAPGTDQR